MQKFPNANTEYLDKYIAICSGDDGDVYTENHHILPKDRNHWPEYINLSENPWNSVKLSGYHHFFAHYWFALATNSLWAAIHVMHHSKKNKRYSNCTLNEINEMAEAYSLFRKTYSISEETKLKISIANTGKLKGVPKTDEHKERIGNSLRGRTKSDEHCKSISSSKMGKKQPKISEAKSGVPVSKRKLQSLRRSPIWQEPLYTELYDLWISNNKPKRGRFSTLAKSNGFPDVAYSKLVDHFNAK